MTKAQAKEAAKVAAIEYLKTKISEGDVLVMKIESVARSGMSRVISVYTKDAGQGLDTYIADAIPQAVTLTKKGLRVSGCGMDMCFWLGYQLSNALFGNGYKIKYRSL